MFLREKLKKEGTLSSPKGISDPEIALSSTLNWMRALAILVQQSNTTFASITDKSIAEGVTRHEFLPQQENTVFEQLLISLHHLASLKAMESLTSRIDTSRSAIVTWYYGVFHAANAMVTAQNGSCPDNHAKTANSWDRAFGQCSYVPQPFGYRLPTLVKKDVEAQIIGLRAGNNYNLNNEPKNEQQAYGACMSYLKGSADWSRESLERNMRKKEKLANFRRKEVQQLRDDSLRDKKLGFVHQAFRYRGKANYREALFITYGKDVNSRLLYFNQDLFSVLKAFLCLAGSFCSLRLGNVAWSKFYNDLVEQVFLCVGPYDIWPRT